MKNVRWIFLFIVTCFALPALAQAVPAPTWANGILAFLQGLNPSEVGVGLMILELVLRLIPTASALSVMVPVSYGLKAVSQMLTWLAVTVLDPLIVNAQNTAPPAPAAPVATAPVSTAPPAPPTP